MGHTTTSKGGERRKRGVLQGEVGPQELWDLGWVCPYVESKFPV